jgi:hypothetical protein
VSDAVLTFDIIDTSSYNLHWEKPYLRIYISVKQSKKSKAVPLHAMEALGGRGGIAPTPTSALDGGEWSASPASLYPRRKDPGTHSTGGWVGPRAGLDTEGRGKILCPCRESNPDRLVVQPIVRHYTAPSVIQKAMEVRTGKETVFSYGAPARIGPWPPL